MSTATLPAVNSLNVEPVLFNAIISGVQDGLAMCAIEARCVGVSAIPVKETGAVTGLIGVHGNVSGFITVNMAEKVALAAVGGLLQDPCDELCSQVVDGVGELTNIISGGIKKGLYGSPWLFSHITVPSVIIGQNYQIAYAKGLQYVSVTFEHQSDDALMLTDHLMQVAISLIRL
jgi:CheY-specific phosphatase CheX